MKLRLLLLVNLVLVLPAFSRQDDDSDDLDSEAIKAAYLNIAYDQHGAAVVNFSLAQQPASWTTIQQTLSQMLSCPAERLQHPDPIANLSAWLNSNTLPGAERQKAIDEIEKHNALELQGKCPVSTHRSGLTLAATIDTRNVVSELRAAGVNTLALWISVPESPYISFSGTPNLKQPPASSLVRKVPSRSRYVPVAIDKGDAGPILQITFGWSRAVVLRTLIRMTVFLLLPIAILLRVRALSLSRFKDDPTGAWFAYMKTLGWCTNGGMLLWYLTNIGARKDVESLLNFVLADGHRSTGINLMVYFIPAALIYLSCISISHRVFVDVKKAQYTWAQFLIEHSLTLAKTLAPIACISVAFGFYSQPRIMAGLMFGAYALAILLGRWKLKLTKNYPKVVLSGELRDRVFGFAKTLGVKLQQIIILPAERMQMANAFASPANTVIFTDFLLDRMSKREVDAIAGHELTHLKRGHPAKLSMAMIAACFAPLWFMGIFGVALGFLFQFGIRIPAETVASIYRVQGTLSDWGIDGVIVVTLAFAGVYALSRRFEKQADAGAVALTRDPEAMITALLKLSSLNLMPVNWGKGTGAGLTHPSTFKRVLRIAKMAGISDAQLQQLISQFSIEKLSHTEVASAAEQHKAGEHYATQAGDNGVTHKTVTQSQNILVLLIALLVVPPALIEFAVERLHPGDQLRMTVLGIGIVLTTTIYFLAMKMLPLRGLVRQKTLRLKAIEKSGIKINELESCMVGFAPGPAPRIYLGTYNFDTGALVLSKDRLVYLGRQLKFSLPRRQVLSIQTGPGIPSWWPQKRIYIRWQDEAKGRDEVFSLSGHEPCSLFELDSRIRELYSKLLAWRVRGVPQQIPPELEVLPAPQIGEVTCKKPRETLSLKIQFVVLMIAGAAIWGVSSVLGIHTAYVWLSVFVLRVFEILPYLFYREPKQEKAMQSVIAKTATATASV